MTTLIHNRARAGGLLGLIAAAALIAGCGSSTTSHSTAAAAAPPAANSSAPVALGTANGADGTYLTGASGRALYLWVADQGGKSACTGACASAWPPVIAASIPHVHGAIDAKNLGLTVRSGGAKQLTYKGHPLYYFADDPGSGTVNGQGSDGFGAKWWLVAPSGSAITRAAASSSSSSGSSGGGGY